MLAWCCKDTHTHTYTYKHTHHWRGQSQLSGKVQGRHEGSNGAYHEEIAVKYLKGILITHCNTLQHTATHYNTLQHTATHCNTLQHTATHCNTLHSSVLQSRCKGDTRDATEHTGWRRLIGSPKLQIMFHERAIKYRSLLRKMTYKDKGSYESSPPCTVKKSR